MGTIFNPIALKMAKTPLSFGHSECNRIKRDACRKPVLCYGMYVMYLEIICHLSDLPLFVYMSVFVFGVKFIQKRT